MERPSGLAQVKPRAPLASDPQDLSSVAGEEAACYRAGEDPGEVENSQSLQGTISPHGPIRGRGPIGCGNMGQRLRRDRTPLGMLFPFSDGAHLGGTSAGFDDGGLQTRLSPLHHGLHHSLFFTVLAQDMFGRRAVMWRIGVQPDPAVLGPIVARDRVPR